MANLLQLLKTFLAPKQKQPVTPVPADQQIVLPINLTYDQFATKIEGQAAQIEVSLDYQDYAPVPTHPRLLEVVVRLNTPNIEGFGSEAELQAVRTIRAEFLKIKDAIYVGSLAAGGLVNSYLYIPETSELTESLKMINVPEQYSYDVVMDPQWQYYKELLPTLEESERIANQKQLTELLDQGIDMTIPRKLNHVITGDEDALKTLKAQLEGLGYVAKGIQPSMVQAKKKDLTMIKDAKLALDSLTSETINLSKLSAQAGCVYIGWEVA